MQCYLCDCEPDPCTLDLPVCARCKQRKYCNTFAEKIGDYKDRIEQTLDVAVQTALLQQWLRDLPIRTSPAAALGLLQTNKHYQFLLGAATNSYLICRECQALGTRSICVDCVVGEWVDIQEKSRKK